LKTRDLVNLLNRAAAALETPADLTEQEQGELVQDLTAAAEEIHLTRKATLGELELDGRNDL
jgi:hypothetical protein